MRTLLSVRLFIQAVVITSFTVGSYAWANSGITYHGRILHPDDTPVVSPTTQFKIQIRTPGTENCLLWEEQQGRNLSSSNGIFTLTIADSSDPSLIANSLPYTLERVFSNRTNFTGLTGCAIGSSYNPSVADGRLLQVYFRELPTDPWEQMPASKINFVPMSLNSVQLEGFSANEFLKIDPASSYTTLTATQVNTLVDLISGTNTQYLQSSTTLSGDVSGTYSTTSVNKIKGVSVAATAPTTGQVLKFDGTNWAPAADATTSGGDASYSAKGVLQINTDQATSGLYIASGVLALPNLVTAGSVGSATEIPVLGYDAKGRITSVSTATLDDSSSTGYIRNGGNTFGAAATIGTNDAFGLNFETGGTTKMTVSAAGDVGIGTTSPLATLDVRGKTGDAVLKLASEATNGTAEIRFTGRASSVDNDALIRAGWSGQMAYVAKNGYHTFASGSGSTLMTIAGGNGVGIGTDTPGAALEVAGQVKITGGSPGAGKVLTSDASGLATWEAPTTGSANGLNIYQVRVATPGVNLTLSGLQTVNGIALSAGDRILVKNQFLGQNNGVYVVGSGAWTRATDLDTWSEVYGYLVRVAQGSYRGTIFTTNISVTSGTIDTTDLPFIVSSPVFNVALGGQALLNNTTGSGIAIGNSALWLNTTGTNNIAIGDGALLFNQTGTANTVIGANAASSQASHYATAIGFFALSGINGGSNVAVGAYSMNPSSGSGTGSANTGVGTFSMRELRDGSGNVALGNTAMMNNKMKSENTAIGYSSMYYADSNLTTGSSANTAIGAYSLSGSSTATNNTGIKNTALGHSSLAAMSSGSNNTGVGWNSGSGITTGSNNVILGSNDGASIATSSNNIIISDGAGNARITADNTGLVTIPGTLKIAGGSPGAGKVLTSDASGNASWTTSSAGTSFQNGGNSFGAAASLGTNDNNSLTIKTNNTARMIVSSTGEVGIGTDPAFMYSKFTVTDSGTGTPASGALAGMVVENTDTSASALEGITFRNYDSGGTTRHSAAIASGKSDSWTAADTTTWDAFLSFWTRGDGTHSEKMRITSNGDVGIGTTNPGAKLEVAGQIKITGGTPGLGKVLTSDAAGLATWSTPSADLLASDYVADLTPVSGTNCSAQQTVYWNTVSDTWACRNIDITSSTGFLQNGGNTFGAAASVGTKDAYDFAIKANNATAVTVKSGGAVIFKPAVSNTGTTIDFANGNLQYTSNDCAAMTLNNVVDGGSYTLVVKGTTATTCSFTINSGSGTGAYAGANIHLPTDHGATTSGKHTFYTLLVVGPDVYVSWMPGM